MIKNPDPQPSQVCCSRNLYAFSKCVKTGFRVLCASHKMLLAGGPTYQRTDEIIVSQLRLSGPLCALVWQAFPSSSSSFFCFRLPLRNEGSHICDPRIDRCLVRCGYVYMVWAGDGGLWTREVLEIHHGTAWNPWGGGGLILPCLSSSTNLCWVKGA